MTNEPTTETMAGYLRMFARYGDHVNILNSADWLLLAADRLESQAKQIADKDAEIKRLQDENKAMFVLRMDCEGVVIPRDTYRALTFCGVPIARAIGMIHEHGDLTVRAESAEAERDAAKADMKLIVDVVRENYRDDSCCFACKFDCDMSINDSGEFENECTGFDRDDCFEWRGLQPQDGEGK